MAEFILEGFEGGQDTLAAAVLAAFASENDIDISEAVERRKEIGGPLVAEAAAHADAGDTQYTDTIYGAADLLTNFNTPPPKAVRSLAGEFLKLLDVEKDDDLNAA